MLSTLSSAAPQLSPHGTIPSPLPTERATFPRWCWKQKGKDKRSANGGQGAVLTSRWAVGAGCSGTSPGWGRRCRCRPPYLGSVVRSRYGNAALRPPPRGGRITAPAASPEADGAGTPAAPQGEEGISPALVRQGRLREQWHTEAKGKLRQQCQEARRKWQGEGARLVPFGTQGRAEDKRGARRQGMCLGAAPQALKVMDTVSSSGVQRWLQGLCTYLATASYTGAVFTEPAVAAGCLPAETSLSYFSPCLWMELLFQPRENIHKHAWCWKSSGRNALLSGGAVSCPSLSIHLQQRCLCRCPFIKTPLKPVTAHSCSYLLLLFPHQRLQFNSTSVL